MNNKFIAGIAAMAISASLMSTVAFAADPTFAVDGDTATLSFKVGENNADVTVSEEAQITMMAYLVDGTVATPKDIPAYSNQTVVALDQVDGAKGFGDVLIAASKLVADKKIAVVLGGSDGTTEKYLVAQEVTPSGATITFMNGDTANPVVAENGKVTLPTAANTVFWGTPANGLTFTLYSWVAIDADGNVVAEYKVADTTEIDATADVTLYAKYATGYKVGMSNASDAVVDGSDTSAHNVYTLRGRSTTANALVGVDLFAGSTFKLGDVNGDGAVDGSDTSALNVYTLRGRSTTANANVNKAVYIVNKTPILVAE